MPHGRAPPAEGASGVHICRNLLTCPEQPTESGTPGAAAAPRTGRPRIPASDVRRPPQPGCHHHQGSAHGQPDKAVHGQIERGGEGGGPMTGRYVLCAQIRLDHSREYGSDDLISCQNAGKSYAVIADKGQANREWVCQAVHRYARGLSTHFGMSGRAKRLQERSGPCASAGQRRRDHRRGDRRFWVHAVRRWNGYAEGLSVRGDQPRPSASASQNAIS